MNKREEILETAIKITTGDRNVQYGDPTADFQRTADMWNMLIKERLIQKYGNISAQDFESLLSAADVGLMQILLKCSRQMHQNKEDNAIDIAGYAACMAECAVSNPFLEELNKPCDHLSKNGICVRCGKDFYEALRS